MIRLEDTSGSAIAAAIAAERHRMGSPTTGMVLTLLVLVDEEYQSDATSAAVMAARQHPMRILTVIPRPGRTADRIDAEISVGGDDGPGEVAVLRLRGALSEHANSVVIPLLLSDTPVVAWWPHDAPAHMADDPIGRHAGRRISDAATASDPLAELTVRRDGYCPGDTDLAWARITPWRSALASALDQPHAAIRSASVTVEPDNPSGSLLAAWLRWSLKVPVTLATGEGPGITDVSLITQDGPIAIHRGDGHLAVISRPDVPDSHLALPRRQLDELIAEELRRLDADEVYGDVLMSMGDTP